MPLSPLLSAAEPPAYTCVNPQGRSKTLLICDHASNRIPLSLGTLGLTPADLESHIAWDPGAAAVARCLSALLDAPLLLSGYSRLVIDCNRPLANPTSIPDTSAGIDIPGNRALSPCDCNYARDKRTAVSIIAQYSQFYADFVWRLPSLGNRRRQPPTAPICPAADSALAALRHRAGGR